MIDDAPATSSPKFPLINPSIVSWPGELRSQAGRKRECWGAWPVSRWDTVWD